MTTMTKILAISNSGGPAQAVQTTDSLALSLANFDLSFGSGDFTIGDGTNHLLSIVGGGSPAISFGHASVNPAFSFLGSGSLTLGGALIIAGALSGATDIGASGAITADSISVAGAVAGATLALSSDAAVGGNLTVTGDLVVNGSTTTLNVNNLDVEDQFIRANYTLAAANGVVPVGAAGFAVMRGAVSGSYRDAAALVWNESQWQWQFRLNTGADQSTLGAFQDVKMAALTATTGTFSGAVSGVAGTFSGDVSGVAGTFSGDVSGVAGTFSGAVSGTTGTFSSTISGTTITGTSLVSSGNLQVDGNTILGSDSSDTVAVTGRVTGDIMFSGGADHTIAPVYNPAAANGVTLTVRGGQAGANQIGGTLLLTGGWQNGGGSEGAVHVGTEHTAAVVIAASDIATSVLGSLSVAQNLNLSAPAYFADGSYLALTKQTDAPGGVSNRGNIYTLEVSGKTELFYTDSAGGQVQITSAGSLNSGEIAVPTLQLVYDSGASITTDSSGPVSITHAAASAASRTGLLLNGAFGGMSGRTPVGGSIKIQVNEVDTDSADGIGMWIDAGTGAAAGLAITGSFGGPALYVQGQSSLNMLDVDDVAHFKSKTGTSGSPDVQVDGYFKFQTGASLSSDGLAALSLVTSNGVAGSISATGAALSLATLSSGTLSVQSAAALVMSAGAAGSTYTVSGGDLALATQGSGAISLTSAQGMTLASGAGLALSAGAMGSTYAVSGGNLALSTVTSGDISLTSAQGISLTSAGASVGWANTGGSLSLSTVTSGALTVASAGVLDLVSSGKTTITSSAAIELSAAGSITTNHNANAAGAISANYCLALNASGDFVHAVASAQNALVLGVATAEISDTASSVGKVAEFGRVTLQIQSGITPGLGDFLYLSATQAGKVTNVAPTANGTTVYLMGKALMAPSGAGGTVSAALHRQFMYNN